MPDEPRRVSRFLKFGAGALLGFLTMEAVVRHTYTITFSVEPGFGYIRRSVLYRLEGDGLSHWNLRDLRRSGPPVRSTPSILVLGDSFTEALMVSDGEVYTQRLEDRLRSSGREVQVLNFGYSGMSAADYVAYASDYIEQYAPRWTVIQLRSSDLTSDAWDPSKTHFRRAGEHGGLGTEATPPHYREARDNPWKQRARAVPSMLLHLGLVRFGEFALMASAEPPLFHAGSVTPVAAQPGSATDDTYPLEEEMDLMTRSYGGRVTYLFLPRYDPRHPLSPESSAERRFDERCVRAGLSCVNLREAYPDFAARGRSPFGFPNTAFNAGHMNAEGHEAAAAGLFSVLARLRILGLF